jgi:ubiquinone/menaquinone biosynthesis C-methylase UbiE
MFPSAGYIGLDCDCKRIAYARRKYPGYRFITSNVRKIPLPDNSIDYIFIISVLHHISSQVISGYLDEFKRILKSEGLIFVAEPCVFKNTPVSNWFMLHLDKGKYIRNEKQYISILKKSGYRTRVMNKFNQLLFYNKIMIVARPPSVNKFRSF